MLITMKAIHKVWFMKKVVQRKIMSCKIRLKLNSCGTRTFQKLMTFTHMHACNRLWIGVTCKWAQIHAWIFNLSCSQASLYKFNGHVCARNLLIYWASLFQGTNSEGVYTHRIYNPIGLLVIGLKKPHPHNIVYPHLLRTYIQDMFNLDILTEHRIFSHLGKSSPVKQTDGIDICICSYTKNESILNSSHIQTCVKPRMNNPSIDTCIYVCNHWSA